MQEISNTKATTLNSHESEWPKWPCFCWSKGEKLCRIPFKLAPTMHRSNWCCLLLHAPSMWCSCVSVMWVIFQLTHRHMISTQQVRVKNHICVLLMITYIYAYMQKTTWCTYTVNFQIYVLSAGVGDVQVRKGWRTSEPPDMSADNSGCNKAWLNINIKLRMTYARLGQYGELGFVATLASDMASPPASPLWFSSTSCSPRIRCKHA